MRIVAVSGVDGSGKSTFVRELQALLIELHPKAHLATAWLRFNPYSTQDDAHATRTVSTLDERHRGNVLKRASKKLGMGRLWAKLATLLYRRQLRVQLEAFEDVDILIADRFVLDFFADLVGGEVIGQRGVERLRGQLPRPDVSFVLVAASGVLAERKHPREDLERILARQELYKELGTADGAYFVDTLDGSWRAWSRNLFLGTDWWVGE